MTKNYKLVKIVPSNAGSGRITMPKDYLEELGLEELGKKPGKYLMAYIGEVEIPKNVADEVGCEQNLRARALIYVPANLKVRNSDNQKTKSKV